MARYKDVVAWIAYNDEPEWIEYEQLPDIASMISVALVADLWGKDVHDVARDVLLQRRKDLGLFNRP
jgi:hypothetical protein